MGCLNVHKMIGSYNLKGGMLCILWPTLLSAFFSSSLHFWAKPCTLHCFRWFGQLLSLVAPLYSPMHLLTWAGSVVKNDGCCGAVGYITWGLIYLLSFSPLV